jgi:6,7-dimethyl-8-ribityllumazine synthase
MSPPSNAAAPSSALSDGAGLRIAIVHARWNAAVVEALVAGVRAALRARNVAAADIITVGVPGSWELPGAVRGLVGASRAQAAQAPGEAGAGDLLGEMDGSGGGGGGGGSGSSSASTAPFDAVVAVGVLVKGETMHFEYIADAVAHGLMRVQLDAAVPVVFGVLTVLSEEQARARAGMAPDGHNHGQDWGAAAVEMGLRRRQWAAGEIS